MSDLFVVSSTSSTPSVGAGKTFRSIRGEDDRVEVRRFWLDPIQRAMHARQDTDLKHSGSVSGSSRGEEARTHAG